MKDVRAKKHLGQHFLNDKTIAFNITELLNNSTRNVVEIGPGMGVLTQFLINKDYKTEVVEIDAESVFYLRLNYPELDIHEGDFLQLNLKKKYPYNFSLIGNFPYNISSQILFKVFENKDQINEVIGMFQKEVADRIIAKFNTSAYGRLSILSNWKLNIKKICDIKPESFSPKPKINSSLLFFSPKKDFYKIKDPKNLEKITRIFFSNRRKMIRKPYNQIFNGDLRVLEKLKINLNLRPQNLDYDTYYKLTEEYEKLTS